MSTSKAFLNKLQADLSEVESQLKCLEEDTHLINWASWYTSAAPEIAHKSRLELEARYPGKSHYEICKLLKDQVLEHLVQLKWSDAAAVHKWQTTDYVSLHGWHQGQQRDQRLLSIKDTSHEVLNSKCGAIERELYNSMDQCRQHDYMNNSEKRLTNCGIWAIGRLLSFHWGPTTQKRVELLAAIEKEKQRLEKAEKDAPMIKAAEEAAKEAARLRALESMRQRLAAEKAAADAAAAKAALLQRRWDRIEKEIPLLKLAYKNNDIDYLREFIKDNCCEEYTPAQTATRTLCKNIIDREEDICIQRGVRKTPLK